MSPRLLNQLNRQLASELGRSPSGLPLYRWAWSEDLTWPMRKMSDGKPEMDYRCVCGLNVRIHEPRCSMTVAVPKYVNRRMCPTLNEQWVVLAWCKPDTERAWFKEFGTQIPYPANGYDVPTNVCLGRNEEPDWSVTWELIQKLKAQRKKTLQQWIDECDEAMALQERHDDARLDDIISDACTAFGAIPGSRKGGVSFPARQTSTSGEEAGRLVVPASQ